MLKKGQLQVCAKNEEMRKSGRGYSDVGQLGQQVSMMAQCQNHVHYATIPCYYTTPIEDGLRSYMSTERMFPEARLALSSLAILLLEYLTHILC